MGVQLFPALEGYDKYYFWRHSDVDWKSVPHHLEELSIFAKQLGVTALTSFISITRDETAFDEETIAEFEAESELIDGDWYHQGNLLWSMQPKWFEPEIGLVTINALLAYLCSLQPEFYMPSNHEQEWNDEQDYGGVMSELEAMKTVLLQGQRENKRFRICYSG
jgi:hypothetical protein